MNSTLAGFLFAIVALIVAMNLTNEMTADDSYCPLTCN